MKRPALAVIVGTVVILGAAIILPALLTEPQPRINLPWQVELTPNGGVRVFGLTVGETTLGEAEQQLGEGEVTMFRSPEGRTTVEAFFDNVNLSGLSAKIVLGLRIPDEQRNQMYERGVRASKLGSGTQKVSLASEDEGRVRSAEIATLTYMPSINLSQELVAKRFGEPNEKWQEPTTGVIHWLYPAQGLDVAFSEGEKEVLQYVPPAEFARLRDPLTGGERLP